MKKLVLIYLLLSQCNNIFSQATFQSLNTGGNWSGVTSWSRISGTDSDGIPDSDDNVIISGHIVNINSSASCNNLTININGSLRFTTANCSVNVNGNLLLNNNASITGTANTMILNIIGNLTASSGSTPSLGGFQLNVTGTTQIDGALTLSSNIGTKSFESLVTISSTGSWLSTIITSADVLVFKNGISSNGTSFNGGTATFNTNSQIISGNTSLNLSGAVTINGITLTNNGNLNLTSISAGSLAGSGNLVQGANSSLNFSGPAISLNSINAAASNNTITYNGLGNQAVFSGNYFNLRFTGASNKTLSGNINVGNNLDIDAATLASSTFNMSVSGNTTVSNNGNLSVTNTLGVYNLNAITLNSSRIVGTATGTITASNLTTNNASNTIGNCNLSFSGFSNINGATLLNSDLGVKTFSGTVTISNSGIWTSSLLITTSNLIFQNGIINNGSFNASAATFNTNNQAISGLGILNFSGVITVNGVSLTNNGTIISSSVATGAITGTGSWIQGINSSLTTSAASISLTSFDASASGNTIRYNRNNAQTIFNPVNGTFHNLFISNTLQKTLTGTTVINGNLVIDGSAVLSTGTGFDISLKGNLTISSSATDAFVQGTRSFTMNGSSLQTFSNTGLSASSQFYNLVINNSSGVNFSGTSGNHIVILSGGRLSLLSGNINCGTNNQVILNHGSNLTGGSATSYINGRLSKIGNTAFTFHIGKGNIYNPITITAPSLTTDQYTAEYFASNPNSSFPLLSRDASLNTVNRCQYWTLNRNSGSSNVFVTLNWVTSCDITPIADLRVASWNGTRWTDLGVASVSGNGYSGTLRSSIAASNFSAFTIGSISTYIPLGQLVSSQCGYTTNTLADFIYSETVPNATQYEFVFQNVGLGYNQSVVRSNYAVRLGDVPGLLYNNTYSVKIRAFVSGAWQVYGNICNITITNPLITSVLPAHCGSTISTFDDFIYANSIYGVSQYEFRINDGTSTQSITRPTSAFKFSQFSGVDYGKTYTVDVRVQYNNTWYPYSSTCTISTPAMPLPQLDPTTCGTTISDVYNDIYALYILGATGYRFRLTNGATSLLIEKPSSTFKLNQVTGIQYGTAYSVDVSIFRNGSWSAYGPACTITSTLLPTTNIIASQCGTILSDVNTDINANQIVGATAYRFKIVNGGTTFTIDKTVNTFKFTQVSGILNNTTYSVSVDAFLNGSWIGYGVPCNITTPSPTGTKLMSSQCGITLTSISTDLYADTYLGATIYRFRITNGASVQTIDKASRTFKLSQLTTVFYSATITVDVDVQVNGVWIGYGAPCNITTPAIPTSKISASQCGITASSISDIIYLDAIPGVTQYRVRLANATLGYNQTKDKLASNFKLSEFSGLSINTTYDVDVAVFYNGAWQSYGSVCTLKTPALLSYIVNTSETALSEELTTEINEDIKIDNTTLSVNEVINPNFRFNIYPNPSAESFNIEYVSENSNFSLTITDGQGKILLNKDFTLQELNNIDFGSYFKSGIYFIEIQDNNSISKQRFIKL